MKEVLLLLHISELRKYIDSSYRAVDSVFDQINETVRLIKSKAPEEEQDKIGHRVIGELVLENRETFLFNISNKQNKLLLEYDEQVRNNPNHPYRISENSGEYVKTLIWNKLRNAS